MNYSMSPKLCESFKFFFLRNKNQNLVCCCFKPFFLSFIIDLFYLEGLEFVEKLRGTWFKQVPSQAVLIQLPSILSIFRYKVLFSICYLFYYTVLCLPVSIIFILKNGGYFRVHTKLQGSNSKDFLIHTRKEKKATPDVQN